MIFMHGNIIFTHEIFMPWVFSCMNISVRMRPIQGRPSIESEARALHDLSLVLVSYLAIPWERTVYTFNSCTGRPYV